MALTRNLGGLNGKLNQVLRCLGCQISLAKIVVGLNGKLSMVRCKICIDVEKCEKLLVPKFNSLKKHIGCQHVLVELSQG